MSRYAEGTQTQVDTSQDEIRRTLKRYGAGKTILYTDPESGHGLVQFEMRGRLLRFEVNVPPREEFGVSDAGRTRSRAQTLAAWQAEERRRWRVLLMLVKSSLEVALDDVYPFDQIMLPYIVLPNLQTVSEHAVEAVDVAYRSGEMPNMLEGLARPGLRLLPDAKHG